jgi:predicted dehydrogenase
MRKTYRVAVVGATGTGDYGHGLDTAFFEVDRAQIVALADQDPRGREAAGRRLGVDRQYADYREMIERERPDIVSIGPRWITERVAMVEAAAGAGCHVYCEKPFAARLLDADRMIARCTAAKVKLAMAHQWRAMPPVQKALADVRAGKYGKLLRMRARPKDDRRGGGEELLVHGTHWFDLMIAFAGPPRWASGHVAVGGRDATRDDAHEGTEPVGPIAGDSIAAMFGFDDGVRGYFDSTANLSPPADGRFDHLYGLQLECAEAMLQLRQPGDVYVYPAPVVLPDFTDLAWEKIWVEPWHFTPEHQQRDVRTTWLREGNTVLANDLIDAIENDGEPLSGVRNAQSITEMVEGVYASHFADGRRLSIPLADRRHPLDA